MLLSARTICKLVAHRKLPLLMTLHSFQVSLDKSAEKKWKRQIYAEFTSVNDSGNVKCAYILGYLELVTHLDFDRSCSGRCKRHPETELPEKFGSPLGSNLHPSAMASRSMLARYMERTVRESWPPAEEWKWHGS
jgi:hypothetical protein